MRQQVKLKAACRNGRPLIGSLETHHSRFTLLRRPTRLLPGVVPVCPMYKPMCLARCSSRPDADLMPVYAAWIPSAWRRPMCPVWCPSAHLPGLRHVCPKWCPSARLEACLPKVMPICQAWGLSAQSDAHLPKVPCVIPVWLRWCPSSGADARQDAHQFGMMPIRQTRCLSVRCCMMPMHVIPFYSTWCPIMPCVMPLCLMWCQSNRRDASPLVTSFTKGSWDLGTIPGIFPGKSLEFFDIPSSIWSGILLGWSIQPPNTMIPV